jgi:hypothetical protein
VTARRQNLRVDAFRTPEEFRAYFKTTYGPTISIYKANAGDPDKVVALDRDPADLARRFTNDDGSLDWESLLLTAVRS